MKKYSMFRSFEGGILLQHCDDPDALADGADLTEALRRMRVIESNKGLEYIQDQLKPILSRID